MRFNYKTLASEHAEEWHALRLDGTRDFPLGFLLTVEETAATPIERCREILDTGTLRGVFEAGKLVGFCGYRSQRLERTRHRAEIGPFFVASDYQGSGAAQVLIQGVVNEARESGIAQLELFVDTENDRAIAFYERQGFERIAIHPDGVRIDGVPRDGYFYRLSLS